MPAGWTLIRTADGSWTALEPERGRALHDLAGARTEARERFVRASGLDRAETGARIRLLDLGTGLGHNLAAAAEAADRLGLSLTVIAVECSPEVLEVARALPPDPDPRHERFRRALLDRSASGLEAVDLRQSDAVVELDTLPRGSIELVFLDGYAPSGGGALWSAPFLGRLADRLCPGGRIVTYSASARVRAALLAVGLEVFTTGHRGRKGDGTLAVRPPLEAGALAGSGLVALPAPLARKLARRAARMGGRRSTASEG